MSCVGKLHDTDCTPCRHIIKAAAGFVGAQRAQRDSIYSPESFEALRGSVVDALGRLHEQHACPTCREVVMAVYPFITVLEREKPLPPEYERLVKAVDRLEGAQC